MKTGEIFHFGKFQMDARAPTLRRKARLVAFNYRAFDVLLPWQANLGSALMRDELLKNVWSDTRNEHNLAQSIWVQLAAREH